MLERFCLPVVLSEHENAPCVAERARYLEHLERLGWARKTLFFLARELRVISCRIDLSGRRNITMSEIESTADLWARHQRRRGRSRGAGWSRSRYVSVARGWLEFLGRLGIPHSRPATGQILIEDYATWMKEERGLSPVTIKNRCRSLTRLLVWLDRHGRPMALLRPRDVDRYIRDRYRGWSRRSIATEAWELKAFLHYAEARGLCRRGIAETIERPRTYRYENLPMGPRWDEVRRLVAGAGATRAEGIRARAILLLLATYGLRRAEVAGLRIEDLDWENERLHVYRSKQRRWQVFPLVRSVGDALIRYLRRARPAHADRHIFLTLKAPIRAITPNAITQIVTRGMKALSIETPRRGPHALRHACATRLVEGGFSWKEIGDHLGHLCPDATRIYAKVSLSALREVASFELEGLA